MRSFMVVVPDEIVHGTAPRRKRKERTEVEALVVDRAKAPFDFAVRLRRIRAQQIVTNAECGADLLKACEPIG